MVVPTRRQATEMPAIATGEPDTPDLPDAVSSLIVCDTPDPSAELVEDEVDVAFVSLAVDVGIKVMLADPVAMSVKGASMLSEFGTRLSFDPQPETDADGSASSWIVIMNESTVVVPLSEKRLSGKFTRENECFTLGSISILEKRVVGASLSVVLCASIV